MTYAQPVSIPHWLLCGHDVIQTKWILQEQAGGAGFTSLLSRSETVLVLPLDIAIHLFPVKGSAVQPCCLRWRHLGHLDKRWSGQGAVSHQLNWLLCKAVSWLLVDISNSSTLLCSLQNTYCNTTSCLVPHPVISSICLSPCHPLFFQSSVHGGFTFPICSARKQDWVCCVFTHRLASPAAG